MERFIGTFFNVFTSLIETFVITWDQILHPVLVEVCCQRLEPLCDTHLRLSFILKTLTLAAQGFLEV